MPLRIRLQPCPRRRCLMHQGPCLQSVGTGLPVGPLLMSLPSAMTVRPCKYQTKMLPVGRERTFFASRRHVVRPTPVVAKPVAIYPSRTKSRCRLVASAERFGRALPAVHRVGRADYQYRRKIGQSDQIIGLCQAVVARAASSVCIAACCACP
jgi:hypothetical protein